MFIEKGVRLLSEDFFWDGIEEMQVGDSFVVEGDHNTKEKRGIYQSVINGLKKAKKRRGLEFKFIIRKCEGGYRIWRTEY